jgi:adenine-specific DNA-methyltransferase
MNTIEDANHWAGRFGLAAAPLFEREVESCAGQHSVLLDGAYGTFAMSVSEDELWRTDAPANWVWSSDVPHHVTVTPKKVAVLRWDRPDQARVFDRSSIERNLDGFYDFLTEDRLRSNKSVVEHLVGFFRRLRSLGHASNIPDVRATDLFTAALARLMVGRDRELGANEYGLAVDWSGLLTSVDQRGLQAAIQEAEQASGSMSWLKLHPELAIRHAGGQLFQEAHFELLRGATDFDLFGLVGTSDVSTTSRGGTHFTPATLARSLVERALANLDVPVDCRNELTVCDPTCGSGAFLHEMLRTLRRAGFNGRLHLIGYDISPAAIAMARFSVASSLRDWTPAGGVELDLRVGDSLGELGMPQADVAIMNPPFIGFAAQNALQREQLTAALGSTSAGRGDYSMAFVVRALESLKPGGVVGTLFPASLLSLKAASAWREQLLDLGDVRFLASIGDFGLFSHALVQVAAAVVCKGHDTSRDVVALITENDPQATSMALRQLRRQESSGNITAVVEDTWSLFPVAPDRLRGRPTWRLPTPRAERTINALTQSGMPTIGDLFVIAQGIQTGLNAAFLLTSDEINSLPSKERRYFHKATMTDSIQSGRVVDYYWVFFPYDANGGVFADEAAVKKAVPKYFERFLAPNRIKLQERAAIVRSRRSDWWGLMHAREWSVHAAPRIITKFFGAEGAFVGDYDAEYFAVMGHVWTLKPRDYTDNAKAPDNADLSQLSERELLAAFVALCNSEVFVKLVGLYSPHVAGGQFDLSARHVAPIPVPDLQALSLNLDAGRAVLELIELGRSVDIGSPQWRKKANSLAEFVYGGIKLDAI